MENKMTIAEIKNNNSFLIDIYILFDNPGQVDPVV